MRKLIRKWLGVEAEITALREENIKLNKSIDELHAWIVSHTDLNAKTANSLLNKHLELSHKLADLRLVVQELQTTEEAPELNTPKVKVVKVKGKNAYQLKLSQKPTHYIVGINKGYATIKSISKGIERKVKIYTK